jgi:hypothetical protein
LYDTLLGLVVIWYPLLVLIEVLAEKADTAMNCHNELDFDLNTELNQELQIGGYIPNLSLNLLQCKILSDFEGSIRPSDTHLT